MDKSHFFCFLLPQSTISQSRLNNWDKQPVRISFDTDKAELIDRFDSALEIIRADTPDEVASALAALDRARGQGQWVAGFASYELGYVFEPRLQKLMPQNRRVPLLCFGVYGAPERMPPECGPADLTQPEPLWSEEDYARAFHRVHEWIGAGDIYQANLTFPMRAKATGDAMALRSALAARQPVRFGAVVENWDGPDLVSRSPELFFRIDNGQIETRPMKGTQPRGHDAQDDARRKAFLTGDEKTRAENLMIVDLLRNDLSRVCLPRSVKVPKLFDVETYATVHQVVSHVTGTLREDVGLGDIFEALYPCGSITGAPKVRSMEIIHALEAGPRDVYCGSFGWAAPDGRAEFNVAIRTLTIEGQDVTLNVGGGVVWDSTAQAEYEEALWKARYAARLA